PWSSDWQSGNICCQSSRPSPLPGGSQLRISHFLHAPTPERRAVFCNSSSQPPSHKHLCCQGCHSVPEDLVTKGKDQGRNSLQVCTEIIDWIEDGHFQQIPGALIDYKGQDQDCIGIGHHS